MAVLTSTTEIGSVDFLDKRCRVVDQINSTTLPSVTPASGKVFVAVGNLVTASSAQNIDSVIHP